MNSFRSKAFWGGIIAAVISGAGVIVWQSGWSWFEKEISGPPDLKVYATDTMGCDPGYFAESIESLRERADGVDIKGGVRIPTKDNPVVVYATLQSDAGEAIVVTGAEVKVLSSDPLPTEGSVISGECGGGVDERVFDVDFSQHPVTVKPQVVRTGTGTASTRDFPFKVSSGDPEQFTFDLKNVNRDVRFSITLNWVADGEPGSTVVDNGGKGYRVMGTPPKVPRYPLGDLVTRKTK